jgi:hypothetical protein
MPPLANGKEKELRAASFTLRVPSWEHIVRKSGGWSATRQSGQPRIILSRASWDGKKKRVGGSLSQPHTFPQRLGQALEKAFSGRVHFDFSHEHQLAGVWWRRD